MSAQFLRYFAVFLTAGFTFIATANAQPITPSKALSVPVGLTGTFVDPFRVMVYSYYFTTFDEDDTYKDLCIQGEDEVPGTRSPVECLPHRTTETYPTEKLSPWYMTNIQCDGSDSCILDDKVGPYLGPAYRGQENMYRYINRLVQPTPNTAVDVCRRIISPNSDVGPHIPDYARMELDNCTNQYILHRADLPMILIDDQGELPTVKDADPEEFCQPLSMIPLQTWEQEYTPSEYYVEAWTKTMVWPMWVARGGMAPKEPYYFALGAGFTTTMPVRLDFGLVNINDLVEPWSSPLPGLPLGCGKQYERIYDPTHPFSPRWDFSVNERDEFSPQTGAYEGDTENGVRCAGEEWFGGDIKTDIMSWRMPAFSLYMGWRISFNTLCWNIQWFSIPCFELFGATPYDPPCPTKWNGEEKTETARYKLPMGGTFRGSVGLRKKLCGPPHIEDLCEHITKPVAPANALKMRENNEDNFPYGVPEGYTFEEYFGDHRPYMRCWDTGMECGRDLPWHPLVGKATLDPYMFDFDEPTGYKYAIMGAGREGQSCTIGGDTFNVSQWDKEADPVMDWMEFKLYTVRGMRKAGINCVPKHEKLYKPMSGEEIIANRAGGIYQKATPDTHGNLVRYSTFPWPLQWRGYVMEPKAELRFPNLGADDGDDSNNGEPGSDMAPLKGTGLDYAKPGEILIFDKDVVQSGAEGTWRLPYLAYVTEVCNTGADCPPAPSHFVKAVAYNHGKFPDACGNTEAMEQGEEYTMYKGNLPEYNMDLFDNAESYTQSCDDPYNSACTENYWGSVKRYFPKDDLRRGKKEEE